MRTKINTFSKLRDWANAHRKLSLVITGVTLVAIAAGVAAFLVTQNPVTDVPPPRASSSVKKEEPKPVFYAPLTGVEVADENATTKPVTAIMIENSPDARPQSGIKSSSLI